MLNSNEKWFKTHFLKHWGKAKRVRRLFQALTTGNMRRQAENSLLHTPPLFEQLFGQTQLGLWAAEKGSLWPCWVCPWHLGFDSRVASSPLPLAWSEYSTHPSLNAGPQCLKKSKKVSESKCAIYFYLFIAVLIRKETLLVVNN